LVEGALGWSITGDEEGTATGASACDGATGFFFLMALLGAVEVKVWMPAKSIAQSQAQSQRSAAVERISSIQSYTKLELYASDLKVQ